MSKARFCAVMAACAASLALAADDPGAAEAARAKVITEQKDALDQELKTMGGWEAWAALMKPAHDALVARVKKSELDKTGIFTSEDGLKKRGDWFWNGEQQHLVEELEYDPKGPDCFETCFAAVTEFAKQLRERHIDLIFMPIPIKGSVYPEDLIENVPAQWPTILQRRRFVRRLLDADVETIDLLPAFFEERKNDKPDDRLYPLTDQHWVSRALQLGAATLGGVLKRYNFERRLDYVVKEFPFVMPGTIPNYYNAPAPPKPPPESIVCRQIVDKSGMPANGNDDSPVLVMGDSFVVSKFTSAGCNFASHLSKELGFPVAFYWRSGAATTIIKSFVRESAATLSKRRVIILICNSYFCHEKWATGVKLP